MTISRKSKFAVLIVAAGRGERAGSSHEGPKQYRSVGGTPILRRTLDLYLDWPRTDRIVVAIHPEDAALYDTATQGLATKCPVETVHGGLTRQHSVLAGLEALARTDATHVLIHDAVRPFFTHALLDRVAAGLDAGAAAILPAVPVTDTLKRGTDNGLVGDTVDRNGLYAAQTPQSFELAAILEAHRLAAASGRSDFTDDCAIAEWRSIPVHIVDGEAGNIKLTTRRDLELANERLFSMTLPDIRTGNGYDVHQLEEGDGVTLCGVFLPHTKRLKGHSDADCALHALTDALLATCGAGDIGDHFPPSDPQWKGAPSRIFLAHAAEIVRQKGGTILNADVSIIAEAPKIGPRRLEMRETIAGILGIDLDRCSVKATTNEKIGFIGREEGISAIATASVAYRGTQ